MMFFTSARLISRSSVYFRVPMIKFRYGVRTQGNAPVAGGSSGPSAASSSAVTKSGEAMYDFQIPQRWKRPPISEEEIEYINRGGPA